MKLKEIKYKENDYGSAVNMSSFEKKISFLNRYFVYKKVIEVDTNKVYLDLSEYSETEILRNASETKRAIEVAKEEMIKEKPKMRNLQKKILLIPASEANDIESQNISKTIPSEIKELKNKTKRTKMREIQDKPRKLLIIESDDEN